MSGERVIPIRRQAFEHVIAAGVQARRRFAIAKAVELHGQAVELASNDDERLRALEELGDDHESAQRGERRHRLGQSRFGDRIFQIEIVRGAPAGELASEGGLAALARTQQGHDGVGAHPRLDASGQITA